MHIIMPLFSTKSIGLDYKRNYKDGEYIFCIDLRSVLTYGEIKYFVIG